MRLINRARARIARLIAPKVNYTSIADRLVRSLNDKDDTLQQIKDSDIKPVFFPHKDDDTR
jgi:hypothetical protein